MSSGSVWLSPAVVYLLTPTFCPFSYLPAPHLYYFQLLLSSPCFPLFPSSIFYSFHLLINSLFFPFRSHVISNFSLFFLIFLPLITHRSNWPLKVWEINFCARWLHRKSSRFQDAKLGLFSNAMSIATWTYRRKFIHGFSLKKKDKNK